MMYGNVKMPDTTTEPNMALGISRAAFFISSDMCAAASYPTNPYDVVSNPRHQATPFEDHPDKFSNEVNTNAASWCVPIAEMTAMTQMNPQPWIIMAPIF